ncbi:MAG: nitroreductase [Clostridia bacterium]|jgi:nitroreductase|nr:nitroreductase [Clostridia bacterium]
MNVIDALQTRKSTRAFKPDPVEQSLIQQILEAANRTPSWANTQPWEIFVAGGEPLERLRQGYLENFQKGIAPNFELPAPQSWPEAHKNRINELGAGRFSSLGIDRDDQEARKKATELNFRFFDAPVVIFPCMHRDLSSWSLFDIGAFSMNIMLAAQHYGLNTIPAIMLAAYPDLLRKELSIPEELKIVVGIALGYGDPDSIYNKYTTPRRPLSELVRIVGI